MIFEDVEKLIKTMKRNDIYSVKTSDVEIVAKYNVAAHQPQLEFSKPALPVIPEEVEDKINKLTRPITDEEMLFTPFKGLEDQDNG